MSNEVIAMGSIGPERLWGGLGQLSGSVIPGPGRGATGPKPFFNLFLGTQAVAFKGAQKGCEPFEESFTCRQPHTWPVPR